jgi:hypothetical protein
MFNISIIHNQIQIDELHAKDIFMYFGIPRTHLQYVNINAAWNNVRFDRSCLDKQKRKLSIHQLVVDFRLANVTELDDQNRFMQH